jgi:predicted phosphodiesterase
MTRRVLVLPERGTLLISTDLHGNREDFERLHEEFERLRERDGDTHWAILGDLVHGPNEAVRAREDSLYDYPDESPALIDAVHELTRRLPDRVHYVLGNHDHGHVGGPHTRRFHADEVAALEARLTLEQKARLLELFGQAYLAIATPCGLLLTHGSPDDRWRSLEQLEGVALAAEPDPERREILRSVLTDYGQRGEVTQRLLGQLSRPELELTMVVHGHDRDERVLFVEGGNQVCPVIFGARRAAKRYLVVDLAARYRHPGDLSEGVEILTIHR